MPGLNSISKLSSLKGIVDKGSPRDKVRNLAGGLSTISSILKDFTASAPGEGVSFTGSSIGELPPSAVKSVEASTIVFPSNLGTPDYPAWVQIVIYHRSGNGNVIGKMLDSLIGKVKTTYEKVLSDSERKESEDKAAAEEAKLAKTGGTRKIEEEDSYGSYAKKGLDTAINGAKSFAAGFGGGRGEDSISQVISNPLYTINLPIQGQGMGADTRATQISSESLGQVAGMAGERGASSLLSSYESAKNAILTNIGFKMPGIGKGLKLASGTTENPFSFQMFSGVSHRSFNMTWTVMALSKEENETLLLMKEVLTYHMMPENQGYMLENPDEFKISYWHIVSNDDGKTYVPQENPYYPRTMACYLSSCAFTPNENTESLHDDGAPVTWQIQLQFDEIQTLDKQRTADGNSIYGAEGSAKSIRRPGS